MNIVMTERLAIELEGLENMVSRYWGGERKTIEETIVCTKAMLENSEWKRRADIRESTTHLTTAKCQNAQSGTSAI